MAESSCCVFIRAPIFLLLVASLALGPAYLFEQNDGWGEDESWSSDDYSDDEGHCIWYGTCGFGSLNRSLPCYYNGSAKSLAEDPHPEVAHRILKQHCHELLNQTESDEEHPVASYERELHLSRVCCDSSQLLGIEVELNILESLLIRCPACFNNFRLYVCQMTCGPQQSLYMRVDQVETTHRLIEPPSDIDLYELN